MNLLRGAALGLVAGVVLVLVGLGVAAPAEATTSGGPLFPQSQDSYDYALSVRGQDIYSAQSDASKAAWTPQLARVAAEDGNLYRAAQVYGNLDPAEVAQVIPINGAVDQSLHGKLTAGMTVTNGATTWKGTGFRFPRFAASTMGNVRQAVGSPAGAFVAMMAFDQRADIANGVVSWVGQDATSAVCSDPVAGGANPINWLTGQNCDQWRAAQAWIPNVGNIPVPDGWSDATWQVADGTPTQANWGVVGVRPVTPGQTGTQVYDIIKATHQNGVSLGSYEFYKCQDSSHVLGTQHNGSNFGPYIQPTGGTGSVDWACPAGQTLGEIFLSGLSTGTGNPPTPTVTWGAPGTSVYHAGNSADPARQLQCVMYGASGNVTNGYTASFPESQLTAGDAPAPVCAPLPNGEDPNRMVVQEIGGNQTNVLKDQTQTPAATDFDTKYKTACGTAPNQQTCLLDVIDISTGLSCFSAKETCANWMTDPNRDAKYQCQYGGQNEPVNQCYIYANTFDPAKRLAGDPYADPKTGNDPGQGTGVTEDQRTMGNVPVSPINPDGTYQSCLGGTYQAFNPVQWVLRPIQCGAEWAAIPRASVVQAAVNNMQAEWANTPFAQVPTVVNQFASVPVMTGCAGIPVGADFTWPVAWGFHWSFGAACTDPLKTVAAWVQGVLSALVYGGAGLALVWYITGALGMGGFGRR
jgi:hypothetical protein